MLAGAGTVAFGWRALRANAGDELRPSAGWLRRGPAVMLAGTVAAFALLEVALFTDNFSVQFVAEHHRRATGTLYTATSAWAGLEGSLLLWTTIIALYLFIVSRRAGRDVDDRVGIGAVATMSVIATFFVGLVLIVSPTFATTPARLADGNGANHSPQICSDKSKYRKPLPGTSAFLGAFSTKEVPFTLVNERDADNG